MTTDDIAKSEWAGIAAVLRAHNVQAGVIELCGFHYRKGFCDGYASGLDGLCRPEQPMTPDQALGVFAQFASNVDPQEWERPT